MMNNTKREHSIKLFDFGIDILGNIPLNEACLVAAKGSISLDYMRSVPIHACVISAFVQMFEPGPGPTTHFQNP